MRLWLVAVQLLAIVGRRLLEQGWRLAAWIGAWIGARCIRRHRALPLVLMKLRAWPLVVVGSAAPRNGRWLGVAVERGRQLERLL